MSPLLFKAWITYFIFYCLLLSISAFFFNISPDYLTRDPAALLKGKFYTGAISNLGILFWTAGATLCWFSYFALLKYAPESRLKNMLLHFGIVTTFLLLDDLYMWHEEMFPKYIKIHEHWLYAGYLMYFLFILIKFRAILLQTEFFILASAFFFMGCSMAIDVFDKKLIALLSFYPTAETLLEDSFKSIGILTWLLYFQG